MLFFLLKIIMKNETTIACHPTVIYPATSWSQYILQSELSTNCFTRQIIIRWFKVLRLLMNRLNKLSLREIIKTQNKTVSTDEDSGSSSSIMQQVAKSGSGADPKPQRLRSQWHTGRPKRYRPSENTWAYGEEVGGGAAHVAAGDWVRG